jgi:hypothetical protein
VLVSNGEEWSGVLEGVDDLRVICVVLDKFMNVSTRTSFRSLEEVSKKSKLPRTVTFSVPGPVFFLSERSLQLGPISDIPSKIYYHALPLGVGFSHSEKTLAWPGPPGMNVWVAHQSRSAWPTRQACLQGMRSMLSHALPHMVDVVNIEKRKKKFQ